MGDIFKDGQPCSLEQILANREWRTVIQKKLVMANPTKILAAIKLNIPGEIKNSSALLSFFKLELQYWEANLQLAGIIYYKAKEYLTKKTGPECFYLLNCDWQQAKNLAINFEEANQARRLFDVDILVQKQAEVVPLSRSELGLPERTCLICDCSAKECGRAKKHSVIELQQKINTLVTQFLVCEKKQALIKRLTKLGLQAMIEEVVTWPKPGLVDPVEHGAHPDMDQFLFIKSAFSLESYLEQCAQIGLNYQGQAYDSLFLEIRYLGQKAEQTMFTATAGINTHKGVIFSLGLIMTAVGILLNQDKLTNKNLQIIIQQMTINLGKDFEIKKQKLTAGEKQYQKYCLGGIRAEAMKGYPTIFHVGLPAYNEFNFLNSNDRNLMILLKIARALQDSTLIKRAKSLEIITWKNEQLDSFFALGGVTTKAGRKFLNELQQQFTNKKLSLGGSADLLIVTLFIVKVKELLN